MRRPSPRAAALVALSCVALPFVPLLVLPLLGAAFVLWALYSASRTLLFHESTESAYHVVLTRDGWKLALYHYAPVSSTTRRQFPVLLVPGLACNRMIFDVSFDRSFARYLARLGFQVFTLELRGHGNSFDRSARARAARASNAYSLDDFVQSDLPAAIGHVCEHLRVPALHLVGHSMGGIVALCHGAVVRDPRVRSITTIASALRIPPRETVFQHVGKLMRVWRHVASCVPLGALSKVIAPLSGWIRNPVDMALMYVPNVRGELVRRAHATFFSREHVDLLAQLESILKVGGLRTASNSASYFEALDNVDAPVFMIGGKRDRMVPSSAVSYTFERLAERDIPAERNRELQLYDDFGHCDLLFGEAAPGKVWIDVVRWLQLHDNVPQSLAHQQQPQQAQAQVQAQAHAQRGSGAATPVMAMPMSEAPAPAPHLATPA